MDDAHEDQPGAELAAAYQRPAAAHLVTDCDDVGSPTGAGAVPQNHVRIGEDCMGNLLRPPHRRPVRIPIPYTPRNRGISPRELLEDFHRRERAEVEAAVKRGQIDTKEPRARELPSKVIG